MSSRLCYVPPMQLPDDLTIDLPELLLRGKFGRDGFNRLRRQGRTPTGYKIGRKLWFSEAEVTEWLTTQRVRVAGQAIIAANGI
jgi:hypothetical protein